MMKLRVLILTLFLITPIAAFAQTQAANKSWNNFWMQFSAAVNKRNKAGVKKLMASESQFSSGGGIENRDEWLQLVDKQNWWGLLQKSVRLGTKPYAYDGKTVSRVTKDDHLIFIYSGGRWRFAGPMGD